MSAPLPSRKRRRRRSNDDVGHHLSRRDQATIRMEVALAERDFAFAGFEQPRNGPGIIAVAINGEKRLMHLGRDEVDAMFLLANEAARP